MRKAGPGAHVFVKALCVFLAHSCSIVYVIYFCTLNPVVDINLISFSTSHVYIRIPQHCHSETVLYLFHHVTTQHSVIIIIPVQKTYLK